MKILSFSLDWKYDASSIQRAEEFLRRCHETIKKERHVWVAFNTGPFMEHGLEDRFADDWTEQVNSMKKRLKEEGPWHLARLKNNLRNSHQVVKAVQGINVPGRPLMQTIEDGSIEGSTINSSQPTWIPMDIKDKEKHLSAAINFAVTKITTLMENPERRCIAILVDEADTIKLKDIYDPIVELVKDGEKICLYDLDSSIEKDDVFRLEEFLGNPRGFLITNAEAFNGMESENIIYLHDEQSGYFNYRSDLLRAISHLFVITLLTSNSKFRLDNTLLEDKFLFNEEIKKRLKMELKGDK